MKTHKILNDYKIEIEHSVKKIKTLECSIQTFKDFKHKLFVMYEQLEENLNYKEKQLHSDIVSNKEVKVFQRYEQTFLDILNGMERTIIRMNLQQSIEKTQNEIYTLYNEIDDLRGDIRRYEQCIEELRYSIQVRFV